MLNHDCDSRHHVIIIRNSHNEAISCELMLFRRDAAYIFTLKSYSNSFLIYCGNSGNIYVVAETNCKSTQCVSMTFQCSWQKYNKQQQSPNGFGATTALLVEISGKYEHNMNPVIIQGFLSNLTPSCAHSRYLLPLQLSHHGQPEWQCSLSTCLVDSGWDK